MFERFTERARQVVVEAQTESRALWHSSIGTEHILLGLLRVEDGRAAHVLKRLGVTAESARNEVVQLVSAADDPIAGQIPFTPRAKKVLELSLREAQGLGDNYIGTEHILLGLCRENEGVAVQVLVSFGVDAASIRAEVFELRGVSSDEASAPDTRTLVAPTFVRSKPSPTVLRLLTAAETSPAGDLRSIVTVADLLLALARDEDTGPLLMSVGLDASRLEDALHGYHETYPDESGPSDG